MRRYMKLTLFWIVSFVIGTGLYLRSEYVDAEQEIYRDARRELGQAAQATKYILCEGFHSRGQKTIPKDIDDRNIRLLTDYAGERGLRSLFTCVRSSSNVVYTSSSSTNGNVESPDIRFGTVMKSPSSVLQEALTRTGFMMENGEDSGGAYLAVYYTREEGGRKWVAVAQYWKSYCEDKLEEAIFRALRKLALIMVFFSVPYVFSLLWFKRDLLLANEDITLLQEKLVREFGKGHARNGRSLKEESHEHE